MTPGGDVQSFWEHFPTWGPLVGSLLINAVGLVVGAVRLGYKVDRLEEKITEKDGSIKELEDRIGLRLATSESRIFKL
jgi:hypothetical protein